MTTDAAIAQAFRECREEMSGSVAWLDAFWLIELRARKLDAEKGGVCERCGKTRAGAWTAGHPLAFCTCAHYATPPAQAAEAVERVARAMWEVYEYRGKWPSMASVGEQDAYRRMARAAIAAMQAGEGSK